MSRNIRPESEALHVHRYPILRLIAFFYKLMSVVVFFGGIVVALLNVVLTMNDAGTSEIILRNSLGIIFASCLAGLTFYAIARLVDLLLETNNHTRSIAKSLEEHTLLLKKIHRRQANPYPRPSDAIAERRVRILSETPDN